MKAKVNAARLVATTAAVAVLQATDTGGFMFGTLSSRHFTRSRPRRVQKGNLIKEQHTPWSSWNFFQGAVSFSRSPPDRENLRCLMKMSVLGYSTPINRRAAIRGQHETELSWLTEERDACGVGFIANPKGKAEHKVVQHGLAALGCMEHRGACLADNISGDGSGIMTSLPWELLEREFAKQGVETSSLPERDRRAVGMVFLPSDSLKAAACRTTVEEMLKLAGLDFYGWRSVPVDPTVLGPQGRETQPVIEQFLVSSPTASGDALEREMYLLRRVMAKRLEDKGLDWHINMYFCSLSSRTIVYKGMTNSAVRPESGCSGAPCFMLSDPLRRSSLLPRLNFLSRLPGE